MALTYVPAEEIDGGMTATTICSPNSTSPSPYRALLTRDSFTNLPGQGEAGTEFMRSYDGLTERPYMCPMHADVWGESAESECPFVACQRT